MAIRVTRLMEYTYPNTEAMLEDMGRWAVSANGIRVIGPLRQIRSAVLPLTVFELPTEEDLSEDD